MTWASSGTGPSRRDRRRWSSRSASRHGHHEPVFDPERFPTVLAVGEKGGYDVSGVEHEYMLQYAMDDFEFGLQRVLDGLEAFVARQR